MAQLAPEDAALLEVLVEERELREQVPIRRRTIVSRFEKYAFAIGVDAAGNAFPIPARHPNDDDDQESPGGPGS